MRRRPGQPDGSHRARRCPHQRRRDLRDGSRRDVLPDHPGHRDVLRDRRGHRDVLRGRRGRRDVLRDRPDVSRDRRGGRPPGVAASSRDWGAGHRVQPGRRGAVRPPARRRVPNGPSLNRRTGCCPGAGPGSGGPCRGCRTGCCPDAGRVPAERPELRRLACLRSPQPRRVPPGSRAPSGQPVPPPQQPVPQGPPAWRRAPVRSPREQSRPPRERSAWPQACRWAWPAWPLRAWPGTLRAACARPAPRSWRRRTSRTHRSR